MTENDTVAVLKNHITNAQIFGEGTVVIFTDTLEKAVAYMEELEAKISGDPTRPFKIGDKVQEICKETEEVTPWGLVDEMTSLGYYVRMGNTRYVGRRIFYYDEEIEPYVETPEALFKVGQKVELLYGYSGSGIVLTAGFVGTVKAEIGGVYEVVFSTQSGTFGMSFSEDVLKAAE